VRQIRFGLEVTGLYGWHLALDLHRAPERAAFDAPVYLFNPRTIRGFKHSYPDLPKTDGADAWAVAERLRVGRLPVPFRVDDRTLPLQRLTRHRHFLVRQLVRHKNSCLGSLFLKCSRLAQACPIAHPLGAAGGALITEAYSAEELAAAPLDALARFLAEKSGNKFYNP